MSKDIPDYRTDELTEAKLLRETIRLTASGVSAGASENVFRELVKHIATALDVDHAFIGVLDPEPTRRGHRRNVLRLAGYRDGNRHRRGVRPARSPHGA